MFQAWSFEQKKMCRTRSALPTVISNSVFFDADFCDLGEGNEVEAILLKEGSKRGGKGFTFHGVEVEDAG